MPRKIKVIDVEGPTNNDPVVVVDSNINETVVSVDIPEAPPSEPEKIKKPRASRAKKENPEPINDVIEEPPEVKTIEPPQVEEPKAQIIEVQKVEEPQVEIIESPKKNIKTIELVECPNCHKKLAERTLKYSHQAVCPATNPPQAKPKTNPKTPTYVEQPQPIQMQQAIQVTEAPKQEQQDELINPYVQMRMRRLNERTEKFKKLVINAF